MGDHKIEPDSRGFLSRLALLVGALALLGAEGPRAWAYYQRSGAEMAQPGPVELLLLIVGIVALGLFIRRAPGESVVVAKDGLSFRKGGRRFEVPWENVREIGNVVVTRGKADWMTWREAELRVRLHQEIPEGEGPTGSNWTAIWVEGGDYVVLPQSRFSVLELAWGMRAMRKRAPQGISIRDRLRWLDKKDEEVLKDVAEW